MKLLFCFIMATSLAHATRRPNAAVPQETIQRLKKLYPEQTESFLMERIHNAQSTFEKWRAFPPYYYDLMARSQAVLDGQFNLRTGMCAGDPHLENFGFLYLGKPFFSLNDLDDVSLCSLNADALRLFIGHRLISDLKAQEWLAAYQEGFAGGSGVLPSYLAKLQQESAKKKNEMPKKYRKLLEATSCGEEFGEVTKDEAAELATFLESEGKKLSLACTRTKDSGGSAGHKRFILIYPSAGGHEAIELKPLVTPAPLAPASVSLKEREVQFQQAVTIFLGPHFQSAYYPVKLNRKLYQRRPLWGGNVGVDEGEMSAAELREVALYEARTLGKYHAMTSKETINLNAESWEKIATIIERKWRQELGE